MKVCVIGLLGVVVFGSHHCKTALDSPSPFKRNSQIPFATEYQGFAVSEFVGVPGAGRDGGVVNSFCWKVIFM
jgi:hypothetical protein